MIKHIRTRYSESIFSLCITVLVLQFLSHEGQKYVEVDSFYNCDNNKDIIKFLDGANKKMSRKLCEVKQISIIPSVQLCVSICSGMESLIHKCTTVCF